MSQKKLKSQVASGAALSYINIALTSIIALFFLPYLISSLGRSEYGLYTLIGSFIGYFALFDFGMSSTIVRYITKYRVSGDKAAEKNFLAMSLIFYSAIALVVILVGSVLVMNIDRVFQSNLTDAEIDRARIMLTIVVISFAISLPGRVYHGVLSGYEQFVIIKLIPMVRSVFRVAMFIAVLQMGYGAIVLTLIEAALTLFATCYNIFHVHRKLGTRIWLKSFDTKLFRNMFNFSFFLFIGAVVEQINFRIDNLLLGILSGTSSVALYGLASNIILIFREIAGVISESVRPRFMILTHEKNTNEKLTEIMVNVGRLQYILLGGIYLGFLCFGQLFIQLWVGPDFSQVWGFVVIIMGPLVFSSGYSTANFILQARKKVVFITVVNISIAMINVIASIFLIKKYGPIGAVIGTAVAYFFGNIIILNIYLSRVIGIRMGIFFRKVFRGILPVYLLAAISGILIGILPGETWLIFLLKCLLFVSVYGVLMWVVGADKSEKELLMSIFRKISAVFRK